MKKAFRALLPVSLFFLVIGMVAFTINEKTQEDFNLQQMGIEALVERHTFALEGSQSPKLQPLGDTFPYQGHTYAIKQPGQFVLGAIPYSVLHALGYSYVKSYPLTSSLVTFFTSGLLCAGLAVALYYVFLRMTQNRIYSFLCAAVGAVGTILLPYAGVAHHDLQATAIVCIGWTLVFLSQSKKNSVFLWIISGMLVGGALFVSMLPLVVCVCVTAYVVSLRQTHQTLEFIAGAIVGVIPVFLYNLLLFGSTLAFPNTISGTTDTTPFFSLSNTSAKIIYYAFSPVHSIFVFMPILFIGLIGIVFLGRKYRRETFFVLGLVVLHMAYISSIETVGHAQYGPRYLLPVLPFLTVGLAGFYRIRSFLSGTFKIYMDIVVSLLAVASIAISSVGAIGGVMYQTTWVHPFPQYLVLIEQGKTSLAPLRSMGNAFLFLSLLCGVLYLIRSRSVKKV